MVLSKAARGIIRFEEQQAHRAFEVWKAAAKLRSRRITNIGSACARLRAVRARPGVCGRNMGELVVVVLVAENMYCDRVFIFVHTRYDW